MTERKVPVQSLIDHIKTAVDVDPWAKEMTEELLKEHEPKKIVDAGVHDMNNHHKIYYGNCPSCERRLYHKSSKYCPWCGKAVKWDD